MSATLDHLVVNTRFATDEAAELFAALGFTLTPRGHHSLGSINHLIVFAEGYLELIGLPLGTDKLRQEILDSPVGIDGLVLASDDPELTHAELTRQGFAVQPVQHFSRPLLIDGTEQQARFATVRLEPGQFPAGRVYYCRHLTPQYVWRPEWIAHDNGVIALTRLTIVSATPEQTRRDYARLGRFDGGFTLDIVTQAQLIARFGNLANPSEVHAPARSERFAAITLRGADPALVAERASALRLPHRADQSRAVVALPQFSTLLEFVQ